MSPGADSASELRGLDSSESELSLLEEEAPVVVVVKRMESKVRDFACRERESVLESVAMEEEAIFVERKMVSVVQISIPSLDF